jgi:uncharacterized protein (DUF1501 family)
MRNGYCDGVTRRDLLQVGALGAMGLGLADFLRISQAQAAETGRGATDRSVILLWLSGGPSHIDTFDPKPEAPSEIRGDFLAIPTNVAGVQLCEHLPRLARKMDQMAVVRSVTHNLASHAPGSLFMQTGNRPLASLRYPNYGSVVARERVAAPGLPPFVTVPEGGQDTADAGYLGIAYNTYAVGADPNKADFSVRSLTLPGGMTEARLASRQALAADLDTAFRELPRKPDLIQGMDTFYQQAYEIIRSPKTRQAFDLKAEQGSIRDAYGRTTFGQGCLLARRLVEAGVRFVQVVYTGWDTHAQNFQRLKDVLLPGLDQGMASLLGDLKDRGLDRNTVVLCAGEFGRTPKVNGSAGRDHWSQGMSVVFAGAGVRGGQVIGSTTPGGEEPADEKVVPEDVAATLYTLLGINPQKEYLTPSGRPVAIVRDGSPIEKLQS